MAIARTQFNNAASNTAGTTIACTLSGVAVGSLVVCNSTCEDTQTISGVQDDLAVAAALATGTPVDSATVVQRADQRYFENYGGGSRTFTTTFSASVLWRAIIAVEYSGAATSGAFDTGISATGSSTTPSSGARTPASNGSLFVGFVIPGQTPTFASPFSNVVSTSGAAAPLTNTEDYIQPTIASQAATWTQSPTDAWGALVGVYKPATGASTAGGGGEEPYDSESFYMEDREYPYVPHIGGRYRGNQNFSYGAQPDLMMQEFGDRISYLNVPTGPTLYTQVLAGAFTPSGSLQKQTNRTLAAGFTPSGALQKQTNRTLAGGFTPVGALSWARQYFRTLTGGFTPSGALTKQTNRTLAGGSTPSGALTKQTNKTLAGGFTPAATLTKQTNKILAGGFTPSGVLTKARQFFVTLAGAFTPAGALSWSRQYFRTLTGGFTPSGALTKQTNRILAGGLTFVGSLTKQTQKILAGWPIIGRVNQFTNSVLAGSINGTPGTLPTGFSAANTSGLSTQVVGSGIDSGFAYIDLRLFGTATGGSYRFQPDGAAPPPATPRERRTVSFYAKYVAGSTANITSLVASVSFRTANNFVPVSLPHLYQDAFVLTGAFQRWTAAMEASTNGVVADGNAVTAAVRGELQLTFAAGAVDITLRIAAPQLERGMTATAFIPTSGAAGRAIPLTKQTNRILAGGFTPSGTVAKITVFLRTLTGGFTPSGALVKQTNKTLTGAFTPAGALIKQTAKILAGYVATTVTNFALWSEDLSNAVWGKADITVTPDVAVAPDGTMSADRVSTKGLGGLPYFTQSPTMLVGQPFLRSIHAIAETSDKVIFEWLSSSWEAGGVLGTTTTFDLTNGTVVGRAGYDFITPVSGYPGWYRLSSLRYARVTNPGAAIFTDVYGPDSVAGKSVLYWGAMWQKSAVLGPYVKTQGAVASANRLIKQLNRTLAGAVGPSGVLTSLKIKLITLAGGFTPSGTVQRKTTKTTQGAIAPSGAVSKRTFRTLVGQIGFSGQISKRVNKTLSGFLTLQGILTRQALGHDFLILLAGVTGARYIIGALSAIRYRLESKSQSRYGPTHTGEASDEIDNTSSSKDDL